MLRHSVIIICTVIAINILLVYAFIYSFICDRVWGETGGGFLVLKKRSENHLLQRNRSIWMNKNCYNEIVVFAAIEYLYLTNKNIIAVKRKQKISMNLLLLAQRKIVCWCIE